MNAFGILDIYFGLKNGTIKDFYPSTFVFGAKAAAGYRRAKAIIRFINDIAALVNNDPDTKNLLQVVFVHNYNVSYAEMIVAATDVSLQLSTAGTEASGTGNMKFMMNGAVTLGTLDGANIEIVEKAGEENNYIFGADVTQVEKIAKEYNPLALIAGNERLKRVTDTLIDSTFRPGDEDYKELYNSLIYDASYHAKDQYFVLYDVGSYVDAVLRSNRDYQEKKAFSLKQIRNIANSAYFSSDRTIADYAKNIWNIKKRAK